MGSGGEGNQYTHTQTWHSGELAKYSFSANKAEKKYSISDFVYFAQHHYFNWFQSQEITAAEKENRKPVEKPAYSLLEE